MIFFCSQTECFSSVTMAKPAYILTAPEASRPQPSARAERWWHLNQPSGLAFYQVLRITDFLCGPLLLAAVLLAGNAQRMPGGVASFLSLRITVKNLALLCMFAT